MDHLFPSQDLDGFEDHQVRLFSTSHYYWWFQLRVPYLVPFLASHPEKPARGSTGLITSQNASGPYLNPSLYLVTLRCPWTQNRTPVQV